MLRSLHELIGYKVKATDGDLGAVDDFYFDDHEWVIRYLVVNAGSWLSGRDVLISPKSLLEPQPGDRHFPVSLTKDQVRNSPGVQTALPVSRQDEAELASHYGWAQYWQPIGNELDGSPGMPPVPYAKHEASVAVAQRDPRLRSAREVFGYHIKASDGAVGHVADFQVETEVWAIRYLVVDTRNWLAGRKVLVAPSWIEEVDWLQQRVGVGLTRQAIKDSPEYAHPQPPAREYEAALHDFYGKTGYWKAPKPRR